MQVNADKCGLDARARERAGEKRLMIAFDDIVNIIAKSFGQTMNTHIYSPCEILSALDGIPKVDAVEVVRCKDCTYFKAHNNTGGAVGESGLVGQLRAASNFCSYGERRPDGA